MKKKFKAYSLAIMTICLAFICLVGCKKAETSPSDSNITKDGSKIVFTDDEGEKIVLDKLPERIISLYSAHTENIFELGGKDKLIGASKTSIYPPDAAFLPRFDYKGDPEEVIAVEPDVVLIRPFVTKKAPDYVSSLKNAGITVISLYPKSLDDFDSYISTLGVILGEEERAKNKLEEFWGKLEEIKATTSKIEDKKSLFFESTEANLRTVTSSSLAGRGIELAGGINIAKDATPVSETSSIASFGAENILSHADDIDIYVSQRGAMNAGGNEHSISIRPGFDTIKAIKEGKVFLINEKIISSPTFRFYKGVRELSRFMYPEIMDKLAYPDLDKELTREDFAQIIVKAKHLPIFVPSSSKYYNNLLEGEKPKAHIYGMFEDVDFNNESFDYIETAVNSGACPYDKIDGKDIFNPSKRVTREELASALFILNDLPISDREISILDEEDCQNKRIVHSVLEAGLMEAKDGRFLPKESVTIGEALRAFGIN